ncbi:MAG: ATP-grasp domain-containing protein [Epsilonproteobacteria bacterium]|nr:ATP-grasp domain-containing protein [Campylobacterota bacterium]
MQHSFFKDQKHKITKVLIANRGEIALRIQHTCAMLGVKTVAVYEQSDQYCKFVTSANQAYQLSGQGALAYMAHEEIIEIALRAGADGLHPGYGFLSENAIFAQKVVDAGLVWIGPRPEVIELMGDKARARKFALQLNIPLVPGKAVSVTDADANQQARLVAQEIGFPLLLKDPLGGGGKGMRCVMQMQDFDKAWQALCGQVQRTTKAQSIVIERYVPVARHVEVQVAGDGAEVQHFYERECSIQRRHQKIIEEAPCRFVAQSVLERMYKAACRLAVAVGYDSIGTVEFMVCPDGQFYFLEMNTRLQVEHSVTEMTTGVDLVALQLELAAFKKLPVWATTVVRQGHAIECRVYAEDAAQKFMPSTGMVNVVSMPGGPDVRIDADVFAGFEVSQFFDPMIAKLTVSGTSREHAQSKMAHVLQQCILLGVKTNCVFLRNVLGSHEFVRGDFHTRWLEDPDVLQRLNTTDHNELEEILAACVVLLVQSKEKKQVSGGGDQRVCAYGWRRQTWG